MKTLRLCVTVAALAAVPTARAVPIYFDFTGRVSGGTLEAPLGAPASGGFTLETDRLLFAGPWGIQYTFMDWQPTGLSQPLATLDVGSTRYSVPNSAVSYASVGFVDACAPVCLPQNAENFNLQAISEDPWTPNYTGDMRVTGILLSGLFRRASSDFPFVEYYDGFDGPSSAPLDILTLDPPVFQVTLLEQVNSCVDGECTISSLTNINIEVDTVSRGVGPRRAVPEPATLGLLGFGMIGALAARRKTHRIESDPPEARRI